MRPAAFTDSSPAPTRRQFVGLGAGAVAGLVLPRLRAVELPVAFPALGRAGDRFTFALLADTHFVAEDSARAGRANNEKFRRIAAELNARRPAPAFVVHLGDVVANPQPENLAAAKVLLPALQPLTLLVHGNHDGREPWSEFRGLQRAANGTDLVRFSFDAGRWHFVVFPFGERGGTNYADDLVAWLAADLRAARGRPTMAFHHHHLLPQGLTQLESYTYDRELRNRLLDTLAAAGNVRWVCCGHVHNGIQAAVKTAWTWRGINFLTAPTVVPPRNFGEEYAPFAAGQPNDRDNGGGYYLLVEVDGDRARVRGRLVGVEVEHAFADTFRPYADQEPLWIRTIADQAPRPALVNGSFEEGLSGWSAPYRYLADRDPGFTWSAGGGQRKTGRAAAHLTVREKGQPWAKDEMTELYQWVRLPAGGPPVVRMSTRADRPDVNGGAYLRLTAFAGRAPRLTYLFDWGEGDRTTNMRMALHAQFMADGARAGPAELIALGKRREALFWRLPVAIGRWREVRIDLAAACDRALGRAGAFAQLGIDRLLLGLGVWCADARDSRSEAWFDDVALEAGQDGAAPAVALDGVPLPVDARVFDTDFGAWFAGGATGGVATKAKKKTKKR